MKYWILNHNYSSYKAHNDLIGLPVRRDKQTGLPKVKNNGGLKPYFDFYDEIMIGDNIAYYCPSPYQKVIGLFKIIEGPQIFTEDWENDIQYKIEPIYPIKEDDRYVSYPDLVENLDFFLDDEGNRRAPRSAAYKMIGTIKELPKGDYLKIEQLYLNQNPKEEPEIELETDTIDGIIPKHIDMIKVTHLLAEDFQCRSYIGRNEKSGLIKAIDMEISEKENLDQEQRKRETFDLPEWLQEIAISHGTIKNIEQIDNLWFINASDWFYIPHVAFEHERSGNLDRIWVRFSALNKTLKDNICYKIIKPLYVISSEDEKQKQSYLKSIESSHQWIEFQKDNSLVVKTIEEIEHGKLTREITNLPNFRIL